MRRAIPLVFVCLCGTVAVLGFLLQRVHSEAVGGAVLMKALRPEVEMQTLETSWKSARGTETAKTTRYDGESEQDWLARHNSAVAAAQEANPPVGQ